MKHSGHHKDENHNNGKMDYEKVETEEEGHARHGHHEHMLHDFKKRFFISIIPTIIILALSPMIQIFLGLTDTLSFSGDIWVLFAFSSFLFFYGGWPFLKGAYSEAKDRKPGMMLLIALAIAVAYFYSSA